MIVYDYPFRLSVVRAYLRTGDVAEAVATRYGISHTTLYDWVRAYKAGRLAQMPRITPRNQTERQQRRKEAARLYLVDHLSVHEVARRLHMSSVTVRAAVRESGGCLRRRGRPVTEEATKYKPLSIRLHWWFKGLREYEQYERATVAEALAAIRKRESKRQPCNAWGNPLPQEKTT